MLWLGAIHAFLAPVCLRAVLDESTYRMFLRTYVNRLWALLGFVYNTEIQFTFATSEWNAVILVLLMFLYNLHEGRWLFCLFGFRETKKNAGWSFGSHDKTPLLLSLRLKFVMHGSSEDSVLEITLAGWCTIFSQPYEWIASRNSQVYVSGDITSILKSSTKTTLCSGIFQQNLNEFQNHRNNPWRWTVHHCNESFRIPQNHRFIV